MEIDRAGEQRSHVFRTMIRRLRKWHPGETINFWVRPACFVAKEGAALQGADSHPFVQRGEGVKVFAGTVAEAAKLDELFMSQHEAGFFSCFTERGEQRAFPCIAHALRNVPMGQAGGMAEQ